MKTSLKILFFDFVTVFMLINCSNFLDEDPKGLVNDNYALTEKGAESEVLSLYQVNTDLLDYLYMVGELGNDLMAYGGNTRDNWRGMINYDESYMKDTSEFNESLWKWLYVALSSANTSIYSIEQATFGSEEKRAKLLSEAHALRAFYLHQIVEIFGPAACFTVAPVEFENLRGEQPGVTTFYKQILDDLEIAERNLEKPEIVRASNFGRMDLGIAKAIRMRCLMSLAGYDETLINEVGMSGKTFCYEEVVKLATELINNYGYKLEDNYSEVFSPENTENNEIIWSIQYGNTTFDSHNNYLHRYWVSQVNRSVRSYSKTIDGLQAHSVYYGREYRSLMPTYYFIKVFNKYDKRRDCTFISGYCRTDDWNLLPDFSDTLLIRSLDVLPQSVRDAYENRGIICDDVTDIYNVETGAVLDNSSSRSCANVMSKWLDYSRSTAKQEYSYKDAILIRLGEVYVTLAEAYTRLNRKEEAAQVINQLRQRAVMEGHESDLLVTAKDIDMNFILDESARELGGELFRWQFLKRALDRDSFCEWIKTRNPDTNPSNAGKRIGIKPYHINRPVPTSTINNYKSLNIDFKQNEGY